MPVAQMPGNEHGQPAADELVRLPAQQVRGRAVRRDDAVALVGRDGRRSVGPLRLFIQTQETADGRTVFVAQLSPRATRSPDVPGGGREPAGDEPGGRPAPAARERGTRGSRGSRGEDTERGMSALERLSLLADLAAHFTDTPDLAEGLRTAGRLLTRRLADWCAVDLFTEDSRLDRVSVVHRDPRGLRPDPYEGGLPQISEDARGPLARALRGAGPLLLTGVPPPQRAAAALDRSHAELFRALGAGSAVDAPLRARRRIFGALTLARAPGAPPFSETDLALVDDPVHSLALGVDDARLYEA